MLAVVAISVVFALVQVFLERLDPIFKTLASVFKTILKGLESFFDLFLSILKGLGLWLWHELFRKPKV